jgi:Uma2 family endonuclease
VEILSPSTRAHDLGTKLRVYREAGVGAYWVVDPTAPGVTVWTWRGGDEVERDTTGDDALDETWPFPVTVIPSALVT